MWSSPWTAKAVVQYACRVVDKLNGQRTGAGLRDSSGTMITVEGTAALGRKLPV